MEGFWETVVLKWRGKEYLFGKHGYDARYRKTDAQLVHEAIQEEKKLE